VISTKPLIQSWKNAIEASRKARQPWLDTAELCKHFYSGTQGFMWQPAFKNRWFKNLPEGRFQINVAKVFEFISIVAPTLMADYPLRYTTNYERLEIPPEFWQDQMMGQMYEQEEAKERVDSLTRNNLMQYYLNYAQREQPGGGLLEDSHAAIVDACLTGRGILRVDPYEPSGGTGVLTGAFRVDSTKFFIDPNCVRSNLTDAKWIAIEHSTPHWELEKRFGWPADSLKKYATKATKGTAFTNTNTAKSPAEGNTMDMVTWYECYSKMGVGTRFKDCKMPTWHEAFESSVGDYAYACFNPTMPELLNVRGDFIEQADIEQVKNAFDWPVHYYDDGRWPVALLDFWIRTDCPYPIAPVAMGLPELICINAFISKLADRAYQDSLTKAAVVQELAEDAVQKLLSYQDEVIALNPMNENNVNKLVSYLQRPPVSTDVFQVLEYLMNEFNKRVGLTELMYGLNPGGKVSRTAADATLKGEAVNTRPEFMRSRVGAWQTEVANMDRICAAEHVSGETLIPLLGRTGAQLWTQLITQADPIVYMREMRCRIEASSIKRPNKEKEIQNTQQLASILLPVGQWYAQMTQNTEPINSVIAAMCKSLDQDDEGWLLPQIPPPQPDPRQEEMAELEKQKRVHDIQGRDLKNKKLMHEGLQEGIGLPVDAMSEIDPETMSPEAMPLM